MTYLGFVSPRATVQIRNKEKKSLQIRMVFLCKVVIRPDEDDHQVCPDVDVRSFVSGTGASSSIKKSKIFPYTLTKI